MAVNEMFDCGIVNLNTNTVSIHKGWIGSVCGESKTKGIKKIDSEYMMKFVLLKSEHFIFRVLFFAAWTKCYEKK